MITFDKLQELIGLLDDAPQVTELTICVQGGEQVTIKKPQRVAANSPVSDLPYQIIDQGSADFDEYSNEGSIATHETSVQPTAKLLSIDANRVGVFHTSKPRIEIGDKIVNGQIVGFIESIKLMNEVRSNVEGILASQMLDDGTPVEYGQQLYSVTPA